MTLYAGFPYLSIGIVLALATVLLVGLFRFKRLSGIPLDDAERNEFLLRYADVSIYTVQPDGTITYASANWSILLGHPENEVVGRNLRDFVHPEDLPVCRSFLERTVRMGVQQPGVEYRIVHANGTVFWHTSNIIPVKEKEGGVITYVGVAHDITRLKDTQAELKEANRRLANLIASREEELRRATKEALTAAESEAGRIGHDIHDGLCQDLIGLSRLAEAAIAETDPCNSISHTTVHRIREQSARLAKVARNFSHNLTMDELEVQTLSEALETLARRTNQLFHTETETNIDEHLDFLNAEQNVHIYRIIREAVANAVKHANAEHIWIDLIREPQRLVVSISNDGYSPSDAALPGDGLGLRQMRMRARLLGGALELRCDGRSPTILELIIPMNEKQES